MEQPSENLTLKHLWPSLAWLTLAILSVVLVLLRYTSAASALPVIGFTLWAFGGMRRTSISYYRPPSQFEKGERIRREKGRVRNERKRAEAHNEEVEIGVSAGYVASPSGLTDGVRAESRVANRELVKWLIRFIPVCIVWPLVEVFVQSMFLKRMLGVAIEDAPLNRVGAWLGEAPPPKPNTPYVLVASSAEDVAPHTITFSTDRKLQYWDLAHCDTQALPSPDQTIEFRMRGMDVFTSLPCGKEGKPRRAKIETTGKDSLVAEIDARFFSFSIKKTLNFYELTGD